jgi:hypothetical protein
MRLASQSSNSQKFASNGHSNLRSFVLIPDNEELPQSYEDLSDHWKQISDYLKTDLPNAFQTATRNNGEISFFINTPNVDGCMDDTANNFNADATVDDGSCTFDVEGCMDDGAFNFNADANVDDGSCNFCCYTAVDNCCVDNQSCWDNISTGDNSDCETIFAKYQETKAAVGGDEFINFQQVINYLGNRYGLNVECMDLGLVKGQWQTHCRNRRKL